MKIEARNIPLASGIAAGSFILRYILYYYGILITDSFTGNFYSNLFFVAVAVLPFSMVLRAQKFRTFQLYLDSFTLLLLVLALFLLASPFAIPIAAAMFLLFVIMIWRSYSKERSYLLRSLVFVVSGLLLIIVAGIIRIGTYDPSFPTAINSLSLKHILVFSIYNNENPKGVPLYFTGGVVIQGMAATFTLSIQSIIIYAFISAFLTENYYLIISYIIEAKKGIFKGAATAVSTALSCQCETISAALPGLSLLFLSIVSVLLLAEGFAVLLFTYLVISRLFRKGKSAGFLQQRIFHERSVFMASSFILILAIPIIEIIGILYGLTVNLLFLLGTGILMFSEGAAIIYLVKEVLGHMELGKSTFMPLIIISTIAMFVWYIPALLFRAGTIPEYFLAMNATSIISGALAASVYLSMGSRNRLLLAEYTLMMFSMAAIVIFYASVVNSYVIWPFFGLEQQTVFSILLIAVSLPLTVLNTNITLNSYATPAV